MRATPADHFAVSLLGRCRFQSIGRVLITKLSQYFGGIDRFFIVQREQNRFRRLMTLQAAEVVGDGGPALRIVRHPVIPTRPRPPVLGQQTHIGVQYRFVILIGKGAKQLTLQVIRILQDPQRLVGMRREYDFVEQFGRPIDRLDHHVIAVPPDTFDWAIQIELFTDWL